MLILLSVFSVIGQIILWLILALLTLSLLQWKVNLGYFEKKIYFALYLYNCKVFSFHKTVNNDKEKSNEIDFESSMRKISEYTKNFKEKKKTLQLALEYAKQTISVQTYSIIIDVGVGNPALTGIVCGAANALLSLISGFIGNILDIEEKHETIVNPRYNKFVFDIGGNVVIAFRVVKAVWLLWKLKKLELIPQFGEKYE